MESVASFQQLAQLLPDEPVYPLQIAVVHSNLSELYKRHGRRTEAIDQAEMQVEVLESMTRRWPNIPTFRERLDEAREVLRSFDEK